MLWEKRYSLNQKRGYLYIRESHYVRDKRTLKKKPPKKGDGTAYKQRSKYTKKKDIYCGKIIDDLSPESLETFQSYIERTKNKDFLAYKTQTSFKELLEDFSSYMLNIHNIDEENFYNGKKIAYAIGGGYFSRETINKVIEFAPKNSFIDNKELERFANRCFDAGIYDTEVVVLLYVKKLGKDPENSRYLEENLEENIDQKKYDNLRGFISNQHQNDKTTEIDKDNRKDRNNEIN